MFHKLSEYYCQNKFTPIGFGKYNNTLKVKPSFLGVCVILIRNYEKHEQPLDLQISVSRSSNLVLFQIAFLSKYEIILSSSDVHSNWLS